MKKIILTILLLSTIPFYAQWWTPQTSGVTQNLNDVYGITGTTVVIVGNGGTILKTIDGGDHWMPKTSGTTANLTKVQFVNPTVGYTVGESGTLLKTTDSGENWSPISSGTTTNLYGLSCLSESVFFISGNDGLIKKTSDGGATFDTINYAGNYSFSTLQFLNDQVGYACSYQYFGSDSNAFIKTIDGGATWTLLSTEIASCFFLNETVGFTKSISGPVSKTIDGGVNLTYMGDSYAPSADLFAWNENVVWSVENNFTLCNCSYFCIKKREITNTELLDPIENCYAETLGNPPFEAITFADPTNGYVVGDYGIIYKNGTGNMENLDRNDLNKKENVVIYPNPASNLITIENNSNTPLSAVTITDLNGRKIMTSTNGNSGIDISSWAKGVYLVQLATDNGIITKKIVKK
ncbi:T9SS type A sorting domain-containing protein [Flavobacterium phycosphaerae]|uniref:T9SS type A sorting domain-containing protein n=1 Tax=Flavobacterium phycosphaerae TaxID=2697515 RepID=UPI00138A5CEE|nr:T9SS type A sorting domain-containing protein [Flavobacterium phycosphaerae]